MRKRCRMYSLAEVRRTDRWRMCESFGTNPWNTDERAPFYDRDEMRRDFLAGVRAVGALPPARGFPPDASTELIAAYRELRTPTVHNVSYVSLKELAYNDFTGQDRIQWRIEELTYLAGLGDARVLFWFDGPKEWHD